MDQPTAEQALRQLEPLVGKWSFEAKWASGEPWPGGGTITFEWHDSRVHLVQRGTIDHPEAPDNVSISEAMRPTGRTSSCTPMKAASVASTG
jgi:hypothetical protein